MGRCFACRLPVYDDQVYAYANQYDVCPSCLEKHFDSAPNLDALENMPVEPQFFIRYDAQIKRCDTWRQVYDFVMMENHTNYLCCFGQTPYTYMAHTSHAEARDDLLEMRKVVLSLAWVALPQKCARNTLYTPRESFVQLVCDHTNQVCKTFLHNNKKQKVCA